MQAGLANALTSCGHQEKTCDDVCQGCEMRSCKQSNTVSSSDLAVVHENR